MRNVKGISKLIGRTIEYGNLKCISFERRGVDVFWASTFMKIFNLQGEKCVVSSISCLIFKLEQRSLLRMVATGRSHIILRHMGAWTPSWLATWPVSETRRRACNVFSMFLLPSLMNATHNANCRSSRRNSRIRQSPNTDGHVFWICISICSLHVAFPISWKCSLPNVLFFFVLCLHCKEIKVRNFSLKFILLCLCNQLMRASVVSVDNPRKSRDGVWCFGRCSDNGMRPQW